MGRKLIFFSLVLSFFSSSIFAYTETIAPGGLLLKWMGSRRYNLAGNPNNQSGLNSNYIFQAISRGFQRWQTASGGAVRFDYWQGTNNQIYEPNSDYNGLSSIYFASHHSRGGAPVDSSVIALTEVWFNTESGEIYEADIVLNDRFYQFTSNPQDTSGYGSGSSGLGNRVFLENVVTHEIGHALGLSHSGNLQSTMLYLESPEQAHLSCDDQVGIRAAYPSSPLGGMGTITGKILNANGGPVFGAQVVAISRRRGSVMASALTNGNGNYWIRGLEPGTYSLMVEPFYSGSSSLPGYYSSISRSICSGWDFGRTFTVGGDQSTLWSIPVQAGQVTPFSDIVVQCGASGGAAVSGPFGGGSFASARPVSLSSGSDFALVDRVASTSQPLFYELPNVSGRIEIRALSFSLYSPVRMNLELFDAIGNPVSVTKAEPTYFGASGFINYDSAFIAENLPQGDYVVKVSGSFVEITRYPAGPTYRDSVPFFVLTGSRNQGGPTLASHYPFNAKCRMDENFPAYQSPGGDPPRVEPGEEDGGGGFLGFCGTVTLGNGPPPGASLAQIVSWFIPWVMMALFALAPQWMRRTRRRALSRQLRFRPRASTLKI